MQASFKVYVETQNPLEIFLPLLLQPFVINDFQKVRNWKKEKEKRKEFLESERLNASFESKRNDFDTEV